MSSMSLLYDIRCSAVARVCLYILILNHVLRLSSRIFFNYLSSLKRMKENKRGKYSGFIMRGLLKWIIVVGSNSLNSEEIVERETKI
jgi:hypothetical protein